MPAINQFRLVLSFTLYPILCNAEERKINKYRELTDRYVPVVVATVVVHGRRATEFPDEDQITLAHLRNEICDVEWYYNDCGNVIGITIMVGG